MQITGLTLIFSLLPRILVSYTHIAFVAKTLKFCLPALRGALHPQNMYLGLVKSSMHGPSFPDTTFCFVLHPSSSTPLMSQQTSQEEKHHRTLRSARKLPPFRTWSLQRWPPFFCTLSSFSRSRCENAGLQGIPQHLQGVPIHADTLLKQEQPRHRKMLKLRNHFFNTLFDTR